MEYYDIKRLALYGLRRNKRRTEKLIENILKEDK